VALSKSARRPDFGKWRFQFFFRQLGCIGKFEFVWSSSSNTNTGPSSGSGFNGPTFGGGPILGVASTNKKDKTVRVFAGKTHYNDWLFIYVAQFDRGGLLVGPVDPNQPRWQT